MRFATLGHHPLEVTTAESVHTGRVYDVRVPARQPLRVEWDSGRWMEWERDPVPRVVRVPAFMGAAKD